MFWHAHWLCVFGINKTVFIKRCQNGKPNKTKGTNCVLFTLISPLQIKEDFPHRFSRKLLLNLNSCPQIDCITYLLFFFFWHKATIRLNRTNLQGYDKEIRQLIKLKSVAESNINLIYLDIPFSFDFHGYLFV